MIYLDNNATTRPAERVIEAMSAASWGNPSSIHGIGQAAKRALEMNRERIAQLLGARLSREILFTSGGTESNNAAILSALRASSKKRIVTTRVEHSSVRVLFQKLEQQGYEVIWVDVTASGAIDWRALDQALTSATALLSVMWVNNETGVIFPIEKIAALAQERGVPIHVDAVQAVGKLKVNVSTLGIDYLSFSAHKIHGPKGIGALYVREGAPWVPLIVGGGQELDRRAGTENVSGIAGFVCALELVANFDVSSIAALRNHLEQGILQNIPDAKVNGGGEDRIANTTHISFPGIEAESLLIRLSDEKICASAGSACSTGALEPSHVLEAMGQSKTLARQAVRFSLSRYTTTDEIAHTIEVVSRLVRELRQMHSIKG